MLLTNKLNQDSVPQTHNDKDNWVESTMRQVTMLYHQKHEKQFSIQQVNPEAYLQATTTLLA
jgi:hypothetical protein